MPPAIQYFAQAVALRPQSWSTPAQIHLQFDHKGHRTTLVSYVMALHDIHNLWQRRIVDAPLAASTPGRWSAVPPVTLTKSSVPGHRGQPGPVPNLPGPAYPLRCSGQSFLVEVPLAVGKPGTGKSQVLVRAMCEASVLLAAPVALLAQGYRSIFGSDLECDTLHAAFWIPVQAGQSFDVNFALNRFNMVVVDEVLLVSSASFNIVAGTLNRLNCRPVVVVAGDRRQQQPLQAVEGRVCDTISILNNQSSVWPYLSFCHELCIQHSWLPWENW